MILAAALVGFSSNTAGAEKRAEALRARGLTTAGGKTSQKESISHNKPLHHYVFFGMDREKIKDAKSFLETPAFEGAQVAYSWRQLEHGEDNYDFGMIREDLAFLEAHGKKLWIQIQDVTFSPRWKSVPEYILADPRYHGGVDRQYKYTPGDEANAVQVGGGVARRWDPAVRERFQKLIVALGKEFDGRVAGINFGETSADFGESGRLFPPGFTPEIYRDAIIENMKVLKRAFPKSVALVYANFMPGEWRPVNDRGYLRAVYRAARELKVGVGGPDLLPYKPGQMGSSYPLIHDVAGIVPVGIAVQDGNSAYVNPKTGRRVTVAEQIAFATEYLHADYIFWCTEEPYYSNQVVPFLRGDKKNSSGV
ncbi:MAG: hypothetical protein M3348_01990 [Acidobacteriota bacterium]|nr:hypothetical protein [Acidobacteriota bacterium]